MVNAPFQVDSRLVQANERTLLAWIRTGIALMTFGFVLARIGIWLGALPVTSAEPEARGPGAAWMGATFCALGVIGNAMALWRYARARNRIQRGEAFPSNDPFPLLFGVVLTILGTLLAGYLLPRLL